MLFRLAVFSAHRSLTGGQNSDKTKRNSSILSSKSGIPMCMRFA
jgi:hypothetical protein